MPLTKEEEIGQFMKMTPLSRLRRDGNQTRPVAQSLPARPASAQAVVTSLRLRSLFYVASMSRNQPRSQRWGRVERRPGVQQDSCLVSGCVGDRYLPPTTTTSLPPSSSSRSIPSFSLRGATEPEPICLSETAAACVQQSWHLVGDSVMTTGSQRSEKCLDVVGFLCRVGV